ncbi:hypothetical protein JKG47_07050 [Acidithiobacillus sp. MC6.1]|nr:hypothetical protein [Acidithiobacillus sp. MC6.1]
MKGITEFLADRINTNTAPRAWAETVWARLPPARMAGGGVSLLVYLANVAG